MKSYWNTIKHYCPKREAEEKEAREHEARQERLEGLKRLYSDVPLRHAVIQLLGSRPRLSYAEIAWIKETDERSIEFEVDMARQDAR